MSNQSILVIAQRIYGQARFVTEMLGIFRPAPQTRLEVKHERDSVWRPLAIVQAEATHDLMLRAHPNALSEDLGRAEPLFDVGVPT